MVTNNYTSSSIESELISDFLAYSTAIYNRALPDIVDGLKIAQRRGIIGLKDLNLRSNSPYCKVSRLEGHVLGRYHPQGSCAGTLIGMGQQAGTRYTLTDVHGNAGGGIQDGSAIGQMVSEDPPAAARYLEIRATELCERLYVSQIVKGIDKWRPNYDGTVSEPIRIVTPLPALLLTGAQGIASGYACHFISYNLSDVIRATTSWIKNQKITDKQLVSKFTNPPEPPQGGRVVKDSGVSDTLLLGKGSVTVYGEWRVEDRMSWGKRSIRPAIVITKLASGSSEKFVEKVRDLAEAEKLTGLLDVSDHSTRDGLEVVLVAKTVGERDSILSTLIQLNTGLKHIHNVNCVAVDLSGTPRTVPVREIIEQWYRARVNYLTQLHKSEVEKLQSDQGKLSAVITVLTDLEKFLKTVRGAKTLSDAVREVSKQWKLTTDLATYVIGIPISSLISTEKEDVKVKLGSLTDRINTLLSLCSPGTDLDEHICGQIVSLRPLAGPSRSVWMTSEVPEMVAVERPLTERERLIEEGDRIGISKREVNRWIKENTGTGKLTDKWEEYKAGHIHLVQMTTRAGKRQRAEELARIRSDAESKGLPARGRYAWNSFMEKNKNVRIDLIRVSMDEWLSQIPKRPHANTYSSKSVSPTPGTRGVRGGETTGSKQPTRAAGKERRSGKG